MAVPAAVTLSFDDFFVDHYRSLLGFATALCGSRTLGEDVVQEALFAASRQWAKISHYDDPAQWARGVVARRSANVRRGKFREGRAVCRLAGRRELPASVPELEDDGYQGRHIEAMPRGSPAGSQRCSLLSSRHELCIDA